MVYRTGGGAGMSRLWTRSPASIAASSSAAEAIICTLLDVLVTADLRCLTDVWRGERTWASGLRSGELAFHGPDGNVAYALTESRPSSINLR